MRTRQRVTLVVAVAVFAAIVTAGKLIHSPHVQAHSDENDSRIEQGFDITPVPLNLEGENRALVGLGSYLVNAVAICNDCHSAGRQLFAVRFRRLQIVFRVLYTRAHFLFKLPLHWSA